MKRAFILNACALLVITAGCTTLQRDYVSPGQPKGYVRIWLDSGPYYVFHVPVYQVLEGNPKYLGELRTTGGVEIGDYETIIATAPPGKAEFFIPTGGQEKEKRFSFVVDVKENATTPVRIQAQVAWDQVTRSGGSRGFSLSIVASPSVSTIPSK